MDILDIFQKSEWEYWLERVKHAGVNSYHTYVTEVVRIDRISGERAHKTAYVTHPYTDRKKYDFYLTVPEQVAFSVGWERIRLLFDSDYNECNFCILVSDLTGSEILRTML